MTKIGRKCDVTSQRKTGEMRLIQTNPESESKKVDEAREKGMMTMKDAKHRFIKEATKSVGHGFHERAENCNSKDNF